MDTKHLKAVRSRLEMAHAMSGHAMHRIFTDWVALMFYAQLRDDAEYLRIINGYDHYNNKRKIAEAFAEAMGALVLHMRETNEEALGPLFMDYASCHYRGQFFTPAAVSRMMAMIAGLPEEGGERVSDPACGAGCMLIEYSKLMKPSQAARTTFWGQDIDFKCVQMCSLNMVFMNLNAVVILGNSLAMEVDAVYAVARTPQGGMLKEMTKEAKAMWSRKATPIPDDTQERPENVVNG